MENLMHTPLAKVAHRARQLARCLTLALVFAAAAPLWAQYDFAERCPSGQMLYFQKLADGTSVRVTHPERSWPYYADNKPVGDLVVPASVTHGGVAYRVVEVGAEAFYRCDSLTSVVLPAVSAVGTQSFCGCTALETIVLPDGLGRVGEGAFAYCRSLRRMELPGSVTSIGISAFAICTGLAEVVMPAAVETLCDATTFHGCPLMKEAKNRKTTPSGHVFWLPNPPEGEKISR